MLPVDVDKKIIKDKEEKKGNTFGGYYSILKQKRQRRREDRKKNDTGFNREGATFLTQGSENALASPWMLKDDTVGVKEEANIHDNFEARRKKRLAARKAYYKSLPLKPGTLSLLGLVDSMMAPSKQTKKCFHRPKKMWKKFSKSKLFLPHTIVATPESLHWLATDESGELTCRSLKEDSPGSGADWPAEFVSACIEQVKCSARRGSSDKPSSSSSSSSSNPRYIAVRRLQHSDGDPERSQTVIASRAALLGNLRKLALDRREREKRPETPSTTPWPKVEIWQSLVHGRGTRANVYRIQWRRRLGPVGTCLSSSQRRQSTTTWREGGDDVDIDGQNRCGTTEESASFLVNRDTPNVRECAMMGRALREPADLVSKLVNRYERLYGGSLRFAKVTCDFVRNRKQEWHFLQVKSFRLTKESHRSFVTANTNCDGATVATRKRPPPSSQKMRVGSAAVRIRGGRKCSLCRTGGLGARTNQQLSFSMTTDTMANLVRDLRYLLSENAQDENATHIYRSLLASCQRQRRHSRYRSHDVCASCHDLHEAVKHLRSICVRRSNLMGIERASASHTRQRLFGTDRTSRNRALPETFGRCCVVLFVHDISEADSVAVVNMSDRVKNRVAKHTFTSVARCMTRVRGGSRAALRIGILPFGLSNTCVKLSASVVRKHIVLNQCCAFEFFCDRASASSLVSTSRRSMKIQAGLSLEEDEEEAGETNETSAPTTLFGESYVACSQDSSSGDGGGRSSSAEKKNDEESPFESHFVPNVTIPLSESPMQRARICLRVSAGLVWSAFGSNIARESLRFERLCSKPPAFRKKASFASSQSARGARSLDGAMLECFLPPQWIETVQRESDGDTLDQLRRLGWSEGVSRRLDEVKEGTLILTPLELSLLAACVAAYGPERRLDVPNVAKVSRAVMPTYEDDAGDDSFARFLKHTQRVDENTLYAALRPTTRKSWVDAVIIEIYRRAARRFESKSVDCHPETVGVDAFRRCLHAIANSEMEGEKEEEEERKEEGGAKESARYNDHSSLFRVQMPIAVAIGILKPEFRHVKKLRKMMEFCSDTLDCLTSNETSSPRGSVVSTPGALPPPPAASLSVPGMLSQDDVSGATNSTLSERRGTPIMKFEEIAGDDATAVGLVADNTNEDPKPDSGPLPSPPPLPKVPFVFGKDHDMWNNAARLFHQGFSFDDVGTMILLQYGHSVETEVEKRRLKAVAMMKDTLDTRSKDGDLENSSARDELDLTKAVSKVELLVAPPAQKDAVPTPPPPPKRRRKPGRRRRRKDKKNDSTASSPTLLSTVSSDVTKGQGTTTTHDGDTNASVAEVVTSSKTSESEKLKPESEPAVDQMRATQPRQNKKATPSPPNVEVPLKREEKEAASPNVEVLLTREEEEATPVAMTSAFTAEEGKRGDVARSSAAKESEERGAASHRPPAPAPTPENAPKEEKDEGSLRSSPLASKPEVASKDEDASSHHRPPPPAPVPRRAKKKAARHRPHPPKPRPKPAPTRKLEPNEDSLEYLKARLTRFYDKYDKSKVSKVDAIATKYFTLRSKKPQIVQSMFNHLEKKYGPEPVYVPNSSEEQEENDDASFWSTPPPPPPIADHLREVGTFSDPPVPDDNGGY
eukprot:g1476.t1